jgi:hypothetical protein
MSESTLQQEIEARRPATEGTLRQMASVVKDVRDIFDNLFVEEGADLNG